MSRLLIAAVLVANLSIPICDAIAGGSIFETFLGTNHSSDQLNRHGSGKPIRMDTSSMNPKIKANTTINKGLRAIGLPALLGPPKVQRQSVWVKGRGFVDITDQAQRQVDADFRRANRGSTSNRNNAVRAAASN